MEVRGIDERCVVAERRGANFVVFVYYGGMDNPGSAVDSLLLTDAYLPDVLGWLRDNLPLSACWSLGIVEDPTSPTPDSDLTIRWIVGGDVLNKSPAHRDERDQELAIEMLARRNGVHLT